MASDQQFCLRWNNHQSTLVSVFDNLLESQTLVDCTLAADGQYLKAHKVVLSACSPYLEAILCQNLDKHPILILKDVKFSELKAMLDYMYRGEVNISQEQLSTFLKAAESLQIKGLTDSGGGGSSDRDRETLKRQDLRKPLNQPVPILSQPRPVVPHAGGLMERRSLPHFPPHIADMQPQSPRHAREGSTSPTARKRRRPNRPSSDDSNFVSTTPNSLSENQPDTSDSCDVPVKQAASTTPNVPNAATKAPETDSNRTTPQPQNNQQNSEQKQQVTVKKEFSEALLTPKTEFDYGNDNSMEDVTYEDDEEEEVDLSKPGTSFAANSQGFPPWQMGGDGSNDDSNNMYSPDVTAATNQNNSQDSEVTVEDDEMVQSLQDHDYVVYFQCSDCTLIFPDEASHKTHVCSAKTVTPTILREPLIFSLQNCESFIPRSFTTFPEGKNQLDLMKDTVLNIGKRFTPILPTITKYAKTSKSPFLSRAEKRKLKLELEKEKKKAMKLKSLLLFFCVKCKEVFNEVNLYEEHPCAKSKLKEKEEEQSSTSEKHIELVYKCSRCKNTFEAMPEFEGHPCFWEKGKPIITPIKKLPAVNVEEIPAENSGSSKGDINLYEEVIPTENVPNSTITIQEAEDIFGPSTSETPSEKLNQEINQTPTPWFCSICNKYFRQRYYLVHHSCEPPSKNPLPYGALGKPPYICSKCDLTFKHKTSYCRHIHHECKMVERPEKFIPEVPKPKPRKTSTKFKPFECPTCHKRFAEKYYLTHHSCEPIVPLPRGGLGKPPFLCSGCGVMYKHKQSYSRHIHHQCGKGRKFVKNYSGKYIGKKKKETPLEKKESVCFLCNKDCHDQEGLEIHIQTDHLTL